MGIEKKLSSEEQLELRNFKDVFINNMYSVLSSQENVIKLSSVYEKILRWMGLEQNEYENMSLLICDANFIVWLQKQWVDMMKVKELKELLIKGMVKKEVWEIIW